MQSHFDLMKLRAQAVDLAAQFPRVVAAAITPVDAADIVGDWLDFTTQTPVAAIAAEFPANVREHAIQTLDAPIQSAVSPRRKVGVTVLGTIFVSEGRDADQTEPERDN